MIKKTLICIMVLGCLASVVLIVLKNPSPINDESNSKFTSNYINEDADSEFTEVLIQPNGANLEEAISPPKGFTRIKSNENDLANFIRSYPLRNSPKEVFLYNGKKKHNQNAHVAVFDFPIANKDLQQCADSVMMVYAEYFWDSGQYDKIKFHFVSGFLAEYSKWRDGYRIQVNGNQVTWAKTSSYDDSYACFRQYLEVVYCYASTLSLNQESQAIANKDIAIGDIFIKPGSPGHVVMVVDVCENETGEKAFLLAQGFMPAQDFHVLRNPANQDNPWYYLSELSYPFNTPEYSFQNGSLKRPQYLL